MGRTADAPSDNQILLSASFSSHVSTQSVRGDETLWTPAVGSQDDGLVFQCRTSATNDFSSRKKTPIPTSMFQMVKVLIGQHLQTPPVGSILSEGRKQQVGGRIGDEAL